MKKIIFLIFFISLSGCQKWQTQEASTQEDMDPGIFGGTEVENPMGSELMVAMISLEDETGSSVICTGTFISQNFILTASHCISPEKTGMRVLFGANPFSGRNFTFVKIIETFTYKKIVANNSNNDLLERNDIALIKIKELPPRALIAKLPQKNASSKSASIHQSNNSNYNNKSVLKFTALGYGRLMGLDIDGSDSAGAGVLRRVELKSADFRFQNPTFTVDQTKNEKGVCFGDSGGPALAQSKKNSSIATVLGVASGLIHDSSSSEAARNHSADPCKQRSIYMNVIPYLDWIHETLKK